MALPPAASDRQLRHRRTIEVEVHTRGTGVWEVDARVRDVRPRDTQLARGRLPAGEPIHDLLLRLVIDEQFNVLESGAESVAMPYPGACEQHGDAYAKLVGLNLMKGFRRAVAERLGGVRGCTHLTELSQVLPTAVVQAFAGEVIDTRGSAEGSERPFQIDRCHALRSDGAVVQVHYPRWHRPSAPAAPPSAAPAAAPLHAASAPIHDPSEANP